MIITISIIVIINISILSFLFYRLSEMNKKIDEKFQKKFTPMGSISLKDLKKMPEIENIDPDHQLLKDVIESAKKESWKVGIDITKNLYTFTIQNPNKRIFISSMMRINEPEGPKKSINPPKIIYFNITTNTDEEIQGSRPSVTFGQLDGSSKLEVYYMCLEYLWSLVINDNDKDFNDRLEYISKSAKSIEKELTSLRREKQIQKLLEN